MLLWDKKYYKYKCDQEILTYNMIIIIQINNAKLINHFLKLAVNINTS
jgi:hypothetical protein